VSNRRSATDVGDALASCCIVGGQKGKQIPTFDPIASPTVRQASDGLFDFNDVLPTALGLASATELLPADRYIDGVDQTSFLLAPDGLSNRKYHYYWLSQNFSGMRCGEYKMVLSATSDDATDAHGTGGFTGVLERFAYPRLYNLYLDPKEQHNYLTRKLAYIEAFQLGMRNHLATFKRFPAKKVMGIKVADRRTE